MLVNSRSTILVTCYICVACAFLMRFAQQSLFRGNGVARTASTQFLIQGVLTERFVTEHRRQDPDHPARMDGRLRPSAAVRQRPLLGKLSRPMARWFGEQATTRTLPQAKPTAQG